jgi:hypothetical protein
MATPEQWAQQEEYAAKVEDCDSCCIVELRARVEALEANSKPTPNPSQIRRSLVERVARAIGQDDEPINWEPEARAAIREVAAWLREAHGWEHGARELELEVVG